MSKIDCYDYVRRYYRVPAYIGTRVRVGGRNLKNALGGPK